MGNSSGNMNIVFTGAAMSDPTLRSFYADQLECMSAQMRENPKEEDVNFMYQVCRRKILPKYPTVTAVKKTESN